MLAVLGEGLFMMIPEQEAVLASEDGQRPYALGVVEGIEAFLWWRSGRGPSRDGTLAPRDLSHISRATFEVAHRGEDSQF